MNKQKEFSETEQLEELNRFLSKFALEDAILILDGPGPCCAKQSIWLARLGIERLRRFSEIHLFSASAYNFLFYWARSERQFKYDSTSIKRWNRENQIRHRVLPFYLHWLVYFGKTIFGRPVFSGELLAKALTKSVREPFSSQRVSELPSNLNLWTYEIVTRRFVSINNSCDLFLDTDVASTMCAVASVPKIYSPFHLKNRVFQDAAVSPGFSKQFLKLLRSKKPAIVLSTNRDGWKGSTLFLKLYDFENALEQILLDQRRFISGFDKPSFNEELRVGLFETQPID